MARSRRRKHLPTDDYEARSKSRAKARMDEDLKGKSYTRTRTNERIALRKEFR